MIVAVIILSVLVALLAFLLVVAGYRLLQHDRFMTFLGEDIYEAALYLRGLVKRDIFQNSPEIMGAHNNFVEIVKKLERYRDVIEKNTFRETTGNTPKPEDRRPIVID